MYYRDHGQNVTENWSKTPCWKLKMSP